MRLILMLAFVAVALAALNIVAHLGDANDEQALNDDPLAEPPRGTL